jgi:hypothetical protein
MHRVFIPSLFVLLAFATFCSAQQLLFDAPEVTEPQTPAPPVAAPAVRPDVTWQGEEAYSRYETARQRVQRNAAWKAEQRRQRIAARKWLGYDPLRPPASPLPFMGSSPRWVAVGPDFAFPGRFGQSSRGPVMVVGQSAERSAR